ncbi:MAG: 2Fe-2S iron-sulfur cluster-binding protein [Bacteroidetes bacterium]|nr:2Fe-2S iron-sulfur cluster-binding protein [Bacteroidota bacterium]
MKVTIDNLTIDVSPGTTVLQAAGALGISIPTMCYSEGHTNHPSCMVCMVKELGSGKLIPSCAIPVHEGMLIQTHSSEIREVRREALELLLGDHLGDCEAPCRLSCPSFMNIPLMNRLIAGGHFAEALKIVKEEIALPLILGYICPAPCEKACHRKSVDEPVSICMLKRFTASDDKRRMENLLTFPEENGRKVAVIGSGPAGLSAAFYLRKMGYSVTIYERQYMPGGQLRYSIPEEKLPCWVLDTEIDGLASIGIVILTGQEIDAKRFEEEIMPGNDAVILATGNPAENPILSFSLPVDVEGKLFNHKTFATGRRGIFGCGSVIKNQQMAIRSVAQGKLAAVETDLYLTAGKQKRIRFSFHSAISHLLPGEAEEYLQESLHGNRIEPKDGWLNGFSAEEAMLEAGRCLHCDCRKPVSCKLRILSDEYHANWKRFTGPARKKLTRLIRHKLLVYEPEKCIKCGICVEITANYKEELGLTFIGRGFNVHIGVPLGNTLHDGITRSAFFCVEGCPTGALSFLDQEEGVEYRMRYRMTGNGWEKIGHF